MRKGVRAEEIAELVVHDGDRDRDPGEERDAQHDNSQAEGDKPRSRVAGNTAKPQLCRFKDDRPETNQRGRQTDYKDPEQQFQEQEAETGTVVCPPSQSWNETKDFFVAHGFCNRIVYANHVIKQ
jgi:hypothetical protein